MSEKYIIGIDEGSQSAKITIFDEKGRVVCEGKAPLRPYDLPRPGYVEHPDDDWWDAICKAGRKCMAKFTGNREDIVAIGLCTIQLAPCVSERRWNTGSAGLKLDGCPGIMTL